MARTKRTVRAGETFSSIADQYGLDASLLAQANKTVNQLRPGLVINVPDMAGDMPYTPMGGGGKYGNMEIMSTPNPFAGGVPPQPEPSSGAQYSPGVYKTALPEYDDLGFPDYSIASSNEMLSLANEEGDPALAPDRVQYEIFERWALQTGISPSVIPVMALNEFGYTLQPDGYFQRAGTATPTSDGSPGGIVTGRDQLQSKLGYDKRSYRFNKGWVTEADIGYGKKEYAVRGGLGGSIRRYTALEAISPQAKRLMGIG